uniref:Transketolase subunit A n=1 Tax=Candidatus Kentrum sp. DK TaxID=2126562 RepID=A0A450S991_9GAMM|nr:MAG: transketolase subunit A [Candidatus Kentron sp. DK]
MKHPDKKTSATSGATPSQGPSQAFPKRTRDPKMLAELARELRRTILTMVHRAGSGHIGGSLSCIDMLACLYFGEMRHYPFRADWPARDRFVLSKGHAAPALYAILARCGYIANSDLLHLRSLGSILQGHPDSRRCPGVEASSGSLGQGLSIAHGMALAIRGQSMSPRVYVLLGDGELQEGQVWEAAMSAGHYRTHNLCALIDANGLQLDGAVRDIMNVDPIGDKFTAFGWNAIDIDGHDIEQIFRALDEARECRDRPTVIVARTVKGKGVSLFENDAAWHGKVPTDEQLRLALEELGEGSI